MVGVAMSQQPEAKYVDAQKRVAGLDDSGLWLLVMVCKGFTMEQSAELMCWSRHTVAVVRAAVMRCLGVSNWAQAAVMAARAGLV